MKHLITSALKGEENITYLDNGATTFHKLEVAMQAVTDAMRHTGNSGRGSHEASLGAARTIYDTRVLVSGLFGLGNPCWVAFTANSTTSLNMAIQRFSLPSDHMITTMVEHSPVLRPLHMIREREVRPTIVRAGGQGNIWYKDLGRAIRPNTKGIVCTHASNLMGNVVDIERVRRIHTKAPLLFVPDASQTTRMFNIHMEHMGIDVPCFTGHRSLMGPQGTGGTCLEEGVAVRSLMTGGGGTHSYQEFHPGEMPEALEAGTVSGHGVVGLRAAPELIRSTGVETTRCRELMLMRRFYEGVSGTPEVTVYGDFSDIDHHAPVVALDIGNYDSGEIPDELAANYGIYTRAGAHCTSPIHQALGTVGQGAVRFSMPYYNTEEEINQAVQAVRELTV